MRAYSFRLSGALYEAGSWYDQVKLIYRAALRVSRDDGKTWTQFLLSDSTSAAYSVVPHPTNGNIIYVGGEIASASGSTYPMMLKTTNGGLSWTRIATSITSYYGDRFHLLEIDKNNPNKLFAGTYNRAHVSTDGGSSWRTISSIYSPTCLVIDPQNSNSIFLGSYNGVFRTADGGDVWVDITGDISCKSIQAMEYDGQNRVLYIGTEYGGVYRRFFGPPVGVEVAVVPREFKLLQNYPNPFNPTTAISYQIPAPSGVEGPAPSEVEGLANTFVSLEVYDVLGREIATLVNGVCLAGTHTVRWDASGLPSGVYLYELKAGQFRQSRRMVLMR